MRSIRLLASTTFVLINKQARCRLTGQHVLLVVHELLC